MEPSEEPPQPATVPAPDEPGVVVWHREHLRTADHPALAAATRLGTVVLPLFVFDPTFYDERGLACDARVRFLHESLVDLDGQYRRTGGGLTLAHGDPVDLLGRFADAGWTVVAARSPTGRYGQRRDDRAREVADVQFVAGDGLAYDADRPREGWETQVTEWFTADPYAFDPTSVEFATPDTGVTVEGIETRYGVDPTKRKVPPGGRTAALERLDAFLDRLDAYPGNISSPLDAREGTSGLSPYLRFGCLSVREVYQRVHAEVPDCRARELFVSRLYWNKHYEQKLADWPGWLDEAANPELRWFNRDEYDPDLVAAWKAGETGYPMVDAAMRCLQETGWLNFRMRAMCVSFYFHVLQQPWKRGADWFHHHLIDSEASINYTQWQYQCGLVGKPGLRVYNPRKQVRDQDPDGEWIREYVPELAGLPSAHLPRPEQAPLGVQHECGVSIGDDPEDDYPYPVVDYEAAKARFRRRYEAVASDAAARLADEPVARRVSLSGGVPAARRIAAEHGPEDGDGGTQADLAAFE